jgi:hypothetical protein
MTFSSGLGAFRKWQRCLAFMVAIAAARALIQITLETLTDRVSDSAEITINRSDDLIIIGSYVRFA